MLTSLAYLFLLGLLLGGVFRRLRLPALLGMLLTGIVLGPYALNLLDASVLVGATVDLQYAVAAGALLCLVKTPLNIRERVFCVVAYMPKATVQAAIGGIPLAMGLGCGKLVLTVAVLAILLTAPLGACAIDSTYRRLLTKETQNPPQAQPAGEEEADL